ncbi:MAG: ribonuclease III [Proteobacteria bacterium]|nr:ribonuclease III [Pseudomonadota bacterium]
MVKVRNLEVLERHLGYVFTNKALLLQALTHKSAHHLNNERLEFLGDAILNFVVADLLFSQFTQATEGELTRARASLVNQDSLHEIALTLSLSDYLNLGLGEQKSGGHRRGSILADTLEAIICAIYQDSDFTIVRAFIERLFITKIAELNLEEQEKDPKTQLQEWLQGQRKALPKYHIVSMIGEPHAQTFIVRCEVEGIMQVVEGIGSSRRIAEQIAAKKMLEIITHDA